MKKYLRLLTIGCMAMFLTFALCACDSDDSSSDDSSSDSSVSISVDTISVSDMDGYISDVVPTLATLETEMVTAYNAISGDSYTDDQTMYDGLVDYVIPANELLLATAEAVETSDSDVEAANEIYVKYVEANQSAFELMVTALEEADADKITEANEYLSEASTYSEEWLEAIS